MSARRWLCGLMAVLLMLSGAALAEAEEALQTTAEPEIPQETVHELVSAMFRAAAGTTFEEEKALRAAFPEESRKEQAALRREELELHRAMTVVWLTEAFRPAEEEAGQAAEPGASETTELTATPEPTPTPVPTPTATPDPMATPEPPVYTIEDAWAQFAECGTGRAYQEMLTGLGGTEAESAMEIMRAACGLWMDEVKHEELAAINDEYACWLFCADTQIDYPVVHGEDNSYYLHRMFNGAQNSAGTLFIDYRNLHDYQDPNTLIYGHHMRNDSMFGALNDYELEGYYEAHPYLLTFSGKEVALIEVFAGYTTSKEDHCYDIAISDSKDMLAFVAEAQGKSDFDTAITVLPGDRLVTLSTCAYAFENARYIAIGRLRSIWREEWTADDAAGGTY